MLRWIEFCSRSKEVGVLMHGVTMDGQQGKFIESTQEMILRFTSGIRTQSLTWTQEIIDSPADLESIERDVHDAYARGADMLIAGLIAVSFKDGKVLQAAEQTRRQFSRPLQKGRERSVAVQLLGGMIIWFAITSGSSNGFVSFHRLHATRTQPPRRRPQYQSD